MARLPGGSGGRLPDATALGIEPNAAPSRPVSSVQAGTAEQGEIQGAAAEMEATKDLQVASNRLAEISEKISQGDDMMRTLTAERKYRMKADQMQMEMLTRGDLSDREVMKRFGEAHAQLEQEIISTAGVRQQALPHLMNRLSGAGSHYMSQMASAATAAQKKAVQDQLMTDVVPLQTEVMQNPMRLAGAFADWNKRINDMPISEDQKIEYRQVGERAIGMGLIDRFLARGTELALQNNTEAVDSVADVVAVLQKRGSLTTDDVRQIYSRVDQVRNAMRQSRAQPKTEWVLDPETGKTRLVTEQEAMAKKYEKAPSSPMVSISNQSQTTTAKGLGELDVERIKQVTKGGDTARALDAELAGFEAALDSGSFDTGFAATPMAGLGKMMEFVGVPPETVKALKLDSATAGVLESTTARMANMALADFGRQTNMNLKFAADALPNLSRTVDGNRIIIAMMRASNARKIELDQAVSDFRSENPKDWAEGNIGKLTQKLDAIKNKPLFDDALIAKIKAGSQSAPKSWDQVLGTAGRIMDKATGQPAQPEQMKLGRAEDGSMTLGQSKIVKGPDGKPMFSTFVPPKDKPPEGVRIPQGWEYAGTYEVKDGREVAIRNIETNAFSRVPVSKPPEKKPTKKPDPKAKGTL